MASLNSTVNGVIVHWPATANSTEIPNPRPERRRGCGAASAGAFELATSLPISGHNAIRSRFPASRPHHRPGPLYEWPTLPELLAPLEHRNPAAMVIRFSLGRPQGYRKSLTTRGRALSNVTLDPRTCRGAVGCQEARAGKLIAPACCPWVLARQTSGRAALGGAMCGSSGRQV